MSVTAHRQPSTDRVTTALHTLRLIDRRESTSREVAEAIARDDRLGPQLLKMARSPLCGITSPDLTVERALVLLGFLTVRKLVVVSLCRDLGEQADDSASWKRALWVGICAEELTRRLDEHAASEALMLGMSRAMGSSFGGDDAAAPSTALQSGIDPKRLDRFVTAAEHMADVFIRARPGLPSTADIDEALEESGMMPLRDGKLAIDIRRGYDLYASLLS